MGLQSGEVWGESTSKLFHMVVGKSRFFVRLEAPGFHLIGLSVGFLGVLRTRQLAFSKISDHRGGKGEHTWARSLFVK